MAISPPSGGPSTGAISAGQVMAAMAGIRSFLAVVRITTSRPTGDIRAAAKPCSTREARNIHKPVDRPHRMEAKTNRPTAPAKTVRAPKRSAIQPLAGTTAARVTM